MVSRPELAADAAWDAALDLSLRRTVYGTLGGLVAAAVLFRKFERGKREIKKKNERAKPSRSPRPHLTS